MQNVLELVIWYKKNFRDLPWRATKDPYRIWLSEVILQQTRVEQGRRYYDAFLEKYPDIESLALADEQEVLKLWQGLGYYSRARNLHKTAKMITDRYHGKFPSEYKELIKLPGIGQYTASAILSFAFGKKYPVLDGNVYRVLARIYGIFLPVNGKKSEKHFLEVLNQMMDDVSPAVFNNAIMEFGAMLCKPSAPLCHLCPLISNCHAYRHKETGLLPVKRATRTRKLRYFNFVVLKFGEHLAYEQRTANDIWKNLWQFPLFESDRLLNTSELRKFAEERFGIQLRDYVRTSADIKHILTHQEIHARFTVLEAAGYPTQGKDTIRLLTNGERQKYPVPVLIENFLLSL